ncbi:hypothetical protein BH11PLA2_BH11PLA2_50620 [soil metagenome]
MDTKFTAKFRATLESEGLELKRVGPRKPNLNAYAERFVQTLKQKCLDHFVCFGVDHLRHILKTYTSFYYQHRPHQGRNNRTLPAAAANENPITIPISSSLIECQLELGGHL